MVVPVVGACKEIEAEFRVSHSAGHGSDDSDVGLRQRSWETRDLTLCAAESVGRFVADDSTHRGWVSDRPSDVGADLDGREACRQRRAGASGRSAGGPAEIIRVRCRAIDVVVALNVAGPDGQVRLGDDHCPGVAVCLHGCSVFDGYVIGEFRGAGGRDESLCLQAVLQCDGYTVERSECRSGGHSCVSCVSCGVCRFFISPNNSIDRTVETVDAVVGSCDEIAAAD